MQWKHSQVEGSIGLTEGAAEGGPHKAVTPPPPPLSSPPSPIRLDIAGNMRWGETKGMRGPSETIAPRLREYRMSFLHPFDCTVPYDLLLNSVWILYLMLK